MTEAAPACPICNAETRPAGEMRGAFSGRHYDLRQCHTCWFAFVANPWTDYPEIYSGEYYAGRGADPYVDYEFEFEQPDVTVRGYEWRGIERVVRGLISTGKTSRWLDFGCGHGGLVRFLRRAGWRSAFGYDTGGMVDRARAGGIPLLTDGELAGAVGSFDVITAIEVIEHLPNPLELLQRLHGLLKPGGLLFLTTGNAAPYRYRLLDWRYVLPDVHISFFEPATLARALDRAGFEPEFRGPVPGYGDIIRFKMLKALGLRRRTPLEQLLPWPLLARVVDARLGVSAHPLGWAR